jgi:hypothetical protein
VESKTYILHDFSLKTTPASKFLEKTSPRLNISKPFLCCISLTKREATINKNIQLRATEILQSFVALSLKFLLTLASRFVKNMQRKNIFYSIEP